MAHLALSALLLQQVVSHPPGNTRAYIHNKYGSPWAVHIRI
jgi:hypothetical protein